MAYEYNCLMVEVPLSGWSQWSRIIRPSDVYDDDSDRPYGIETEPHVTILYGIHGNISIRQIVEELQLPRIKDIQLEIIGISKFSGSGYEVLKFDVESPQLRQINQQIKKTFPYTTDYEEYIPHLTIGYVHPGCADGYIQRFNKRSKVMVRPSHYLYSTSDGRKYRFK